MSAHITVITRRSDRRIMGKLGTRVNLCGGAFTDRDVLLRDARKMSGIEAKDWSVCEDCIRVMQSQEHARLYSEGR